MMFNLELPMGHTFQSVREASRNGRIAVAMSFDARPLTCRARALRGRSIIDFDLFRGNHDLRKEHREALWREYLDYCKAFGFRSRTHPHFSKTSILIDVKSEHADYWFNSLLTAISNVDNLERIRCEFFRDYVARRCRTIAAKAIVTSAQRIDDGDILASVTPAWHEIVKLLQFDWV